MIIFQPKEKKQKKKKRKKEKKKKGKKEKRKKRKKKKKEKKKKRKVQFSCKIRVKEIFYLKDFQSPSEGDWEKWLAQSLHLLWSLRSENGKRILVIKK